MICQVTDTVKRYHSGREVCLATRLGKAEYKRRTSLMWRRQGFTCCLCDKPMVESEATFEHQDGRGSGGGRRDDRIEKKGKWYNGAAHGRCNRLKGSERLNYNDKYRQPSQGAMAVADHVCLDGELSRLRPAGSVEQVAIDDQREAAVAEHEPKLPDVLGTCGVQEPKVEPD